MGFQTVEVGVGTGDEAARIAGTQFAVRERENGGVAVGDEFMVHDAWADDRLVPLVLEHVRRLPCLATAGVGKDGPG